TFTDVVDEQGRAAKVLSTPADPSVAVGRALGAVGRQRPAVLAHGTTVATNALLEGQGAPVVLVTTAGFEDLIEIARQDRPSLYDAFADRPEPLVARERRLGLDERVGAAGEVLRAPDLRGLG